MDAIKILTKNGWEIIGEEKQKNWLMGFINYVAWDNANKCWQGIISTGNKNVDNVLKQNNFNKKFQNLGYESSKAGKGFALYAIRIDNGIYINYSRSSNTVDNLNSLKEITLSTGNMISYEGSNYELLYKMFKKGNNVYSNKIIIVNNTEIKLGNDFLIPNITEIPAEIITNNFLGTPDIPIELKDQLEVIDNLISDIFPEWQYTRTQYVNNRNYNTSTKASDWDNKIKNGRNHDINAPEGIIASSLTPLISNASNVEILNRQIAFIEDRILKYAMQYRDGSVSGTNKTVAEIMSQNQQAFEYMTSKMEHIREQLTSFIEKLASLMGEDVSTIDIQMKESPLEKYKLEKLSADLEVVKADANAKNASAENPRTQNDNQTIDGGIVNGQHS